MKLLLVEDEKDLSYSISKILTISNYLVDCAYDGEEALKKIRESNYDGIVLDIMLPKLNGVAVLKQMRAEGNDTPTILLTAKSGLEDKVQGLDAGADDYLTKPFETKELLARIRALLRRKGKVSDGFNVGNINLDHNTFELKGPNGTINLTNTEYRLLEYLIKNKDSVVPTEKLMEDLWPNDADVEINVVWTYITALRRKLDKVGSNMAIKAARGVGYKLTPIGK